MKLLRMSKQGCGAYRLGSKFHRPVPKHMTWRCKAVNSVPDRFIRTKQPNFLNSTTIPVKLYQSPRWSCTTSEYASITSNLEKISRLTTIQIIKNESKPSHELVAEKELSAYSRFTKNKCVLTLSIRDLIANTTKQLWRIHDRLQQDSSRAYETWPTARCGRRRHVSLPHAKDTL